LKLQHLQALLRVTAALWQALLQPHKLKPQNLIDPVVEISENTFRTAAFMLRYSK